LQHGDQIDVCSPAVLHEAADNALHCGDGSRDDALGDREAAIRPSVRESLNRHLGEDRSSGRRVAPGTLSQSGDAVRRNICRDVGRIEAVVERAADPLHWNRRVNREPTPRGGAAPVVHGEPRDPLDPRDRMGAEGKDRDARLDEKRGSRAVASFAYAQQRVVDDDRLVRQARQSSGGNGVCGPRCHRRLRLQGSCVDQKDQHRAGRRRATRSLQLWQHFSSRNVEGSR
jgi:hypothetical protein